VKQVPVPVVPGLGQLVAGVMTDGTITNIHLSEHQPKFRPMYFLPCRFHFADGFQKNTGTGECFTPSSRQAQASASARA